MAFEPPPNIMKAGERPAKVRTGARTATKGQERDMLDKLSALADTPQVLVPEWLGPGKSPFEKHVKKLAKIQTLRGKERRLRWAARGKRIWNGYAATLLVVEGGKIPSFAPIKFQDREVKFVYRPGTGRNALIAVQHHDDPEVRLLGYAAEVKGSKLFLVSGRGHFVALPQGGEVPLDILEELFEDNGATLEADARVLRCPHAEDEEPRIAFTVKGVDARMTLCQACLKDIGGSVVALLDRRVLGPDGQVHVERALEGRLYTLRPDESIEGYETLAAAAFKEAQAYADENFSSYSDLELLGWTRERLLKRLDERREGFLLVGDDLWLTGFEQAADAYVDSDLERRALKAAFKIRPPHLKSSDRSLTKILEPYWKEHGTSILQELGGTLLKEQELGQLARLTPSEAIAGLARILGVRERFKDFAQFKSVDPALEFVITCLQIQRAGEQRVLLERLHSAAKEPERRALALAMARAFGEHAALEWQYAQHEKDAASFVEPYVREVIAASPGKFADAVGKLAGILGVEKPTLA